VWRAETGMVGELVITFVFGDLEWMALPFHSDPRVNT
jgi:hypothetical protein